MPKKLWIRLGDNADYEVADSPYDAGYSVGSYVMGQPSELAVNWRGKGVEVPPYFANYNYISLFWGDGDAQPVSNAELTKAQKAEFKRGLYEGADIPVLKPLSKTKTGRAKSKPRRKSSAQLSLSRIR